MPRCPQTSSHGSCSTGGRLSYRCGPLTGGLGGVGSGPGTLCRMGCSKTDMRHGGLECRGLEGLQVCLMQQRTHWRSHGHGVRRLVVAGQMLTTTCMTGDDVEQNMWSKMQQAVVKDAQAYLHCPAVLSHHTAMSMPRSLTWQGRAGSKSSSTATGYHALYQSNCALSCCCCSAASAAGVAVNESAAEWLSCWCSAANEACRPATACSGREIRLCGLAWCNKCCAQAGVRLWSWLVVVMGECDPSIIKTQHCAMSGWFFVVKCAVTKVSNEGWNGLHATQPIHRSFSQMLGWSAHAV
jgi:hypothetical protein